MRKIKIIEHISLDGVIQGPGGPDEDDFAHGGWAVPHFDPAVGNAIDAAQGERFDLLLGRRTYDIFAGHWPDIKGDEMADRLNTAAKYVVTHRPDNLKWDPVTALGPDIAADVGNIKQQDGADLVVWGSSTLFPVLLQHGLADEVLLLVFPVLLGKGKRIFSDDSVPGEMKLIGTTATPSGVILSTYKPTGELRTGTFADAEN